MTVSLTFAFNPDEARDEHGRWTDGGAGASPATSAARSLSAAYGSRSLIQADVAGWRDSKPWNADKQTVELGRIPGIGYSARRHGTEDASYLPDGRIVVHDAYFERDRATREAILYHEAGHGLESSFDLARFRSIGVDDPLSIAALPGGQNLGSNYSEVLAEAYSALWTDPGWFDRSGAGEIHDLVTRMARTEGFPLP